MMGALDPYKAALRWWLGLLVLAALVGAGVWIGRALNADAVSDLELKVERQGKAHAAALAKKDAALRASATALRGAAAAVREVEAEAQRRIAAAAEEAKRAEQAAKAAQAAERRMHAQLQRLQRDWDEAARNPDCAALMAIDLRKVCGL